MIFAEFKFTSKPHYFGHVPFIPLDVNPLDGRVGLVLPARSPEGNAGRDEEILWIMLHEERKRNVDVAHLEGSYSDVVSPIGRGNEDGIMTYLTSLPLCVVRVKVRLVVRDHGARVAQCGAVWCVLIRIMRGDDQDRHFIWAFLRVCFFQVLKKTEKIPFSMRE